MFKLGRRGSLVIKTFVKGPGSISLRDAMCVAHFGNISNIHLLIFKLFSMIMRLFTRIKRNYLKNHRRNVIHKWWLYELVCSEKTKLLNINNNQIDCNVTISLELQPFEGNYILNVFFIWNFEMEKMKPDIHIFHNSNKTYNGNDANAFKCIKIGIFLVLLAFCFEVLLREHIDHNRHKYAIYIW